MWQISEKVITRDVYKSVSWIHVLDTEAFNSYMQPL